MGRTVAAGRTAARQGYHQCRTVLPSPGTSPPHRNALPLATALMPAQGQVMALLQVSQTSRTTPPLSQMQSRGIDQMVVVRLLPVLYTFLLNDVATQVLTSAFGLSYPSWL